jgi:hypothetical protein
LVKWRKVYLQITNNRVKTLFDRLAALEKEQDTTLKELQRALSIQTQAECNLRSSRLGVFPELKDADLSSVLGMDLTDLGDLALDPKFPLGELALNLPDPVTTQSDPAPAVRKPKRLKITILAPRPVTVIGSTTITRAKPGTKPSKWFSRRPPICQKPSKRFGPPTANAANDDPTSSSAIVID